MKKLYFFTLITLLLVGLSACKDDGEILDPTGTPDMIKTYKLSGLLSFDETSNQYVLAVSDVSNANGDPEEQLNKVLRENKIYVHPTFTPEEIYNTLNEYVGAYVSTTIDEIDVGILLTGEDKMLPLKQDLNFATSKSIIEQICDDSPEVFPEAYTTTPLSRSSYLLSGHYEIVNVFPRDNMT